MSAKSADLGGVDEQAGPCSQATAAATPTTSPRSLTSGPPLSPSSIGTDADMTRALAKLLAPTEISLFERRRLAHAADDAPQRIDVVTAADDVDAVARPGGVRGEGQFLHAVRQRIQLDESQVHAGVARQHAAAHPQVRHVCSS